MKLRFTRQAVQDLEEIGAYLRLRNPMAATRVRAAILESLKDIADFPEIGRQQSVDGVRKYVTRGHPYLVYYSSDAEVVIVLSVRHAARQRDYADR
jgi:addiction module RelE/StbE family toxin